MSFCFDVMHRAIATLDGNEQVIFHLQQAVDRLHALAHQQHNVLNQDDILREHARALKEAMSIPSTWEEL